MSAENFELRVKDGGIYWGNQRVSIKGVNWFGFETPDFALHGLWYVAAYLAKVMCRSLPQQSFMPLT